MELLDDVQAALSRYSNATGSPNSRLSLPAGRFARTVNRALVQRRVTVRRRRAGENGSGCPDVAGSTTSSSGSPAESRCFLKRQLLSRPPRFVNVAITSSVLDAGFRARPMSPTSRTRGG